MISAGSVLGLVSGLISMLAVANTRAEAVPEPAPSITDNSALRAAPTTAFPAGVWRLSFGNAIVAPPLFYRPDRTACRLNSGDGDNGSQVRSADGRCWLAVFPPGGVDVHEFGARGNQASDDFAPIQAAIDYVQKAGGGAVTVGRGNYCIKTGGLRITAPFTRLVGDGAKIQTCGADVPLIALNARRDQIEHLQLAGSGIDARHDAIALGPACTECRLDDLFVIGGRAAIRAQCTDCTINNVFASQAYGRAILFVAGSPAQWAGGPYVTRGKFDQAWPVATPTYGTVFAGWAPGKTYAKGAVVQLGAYYVQASQSGISGAAAPALRDYGAAIDDGSVRWLLAGPAEYASLLIDSNTVDYREVNSDHTGAFTYGVAIVNDAPGGAPPQTITLVDTVCGAVVRDCLHAQAGNALIVRGGFLSNCIAAGCAGVATEGGWQGDAVIQGMTIFQNGVGILDNAGKSLLAEGNIIGASRIAAIRVGAGIGDFNLADNLLGSAGWGPNPIGVWVADGPADRYAIVNNNCAGARQCVRDGGTGKHKLVYQLTDSPSGQAALPADRLNPRKPRQ
jgi:hypothetical protein